MATIVAHLSERDLIPNLLWSDEAKSEVSDSDKRASLSRPGLNYGSKMFCWICPMADGKHSNMMID